MLTIKKRPARTDSQAAAAHEAYETHAAEHAGRAEHACAIHGAEHTAEHCPDAIRTLAYHKWEAAGMPASDGVEFWLAAEAELSAACG